LSRYSLRLPGFHRAAFSNKPRQICSKRVVLNSADIYDFSTLTVKAGLILNLSQGLHPSLGSYPSQGSYPSHLLSPLRVVFMGTPLFALPSFQSILRSEHVVGVVTQPDRPQGRGMVMTASPIKEEARKHSLPVYQPVRIRQDVALIKTLADLAPDIIIVVAFGQILPASVLKIPRLGCMNVHASLLPKYRGASPIQYALICGEEKTGVTTMLMDEGMDTGPILLQQTAEILPSETAKALAERLSTMGAALLMETLAQFKINQLVPIQQDSLGVLPAAAPLLNKEDGVIRWQESASAIFNRWRGVFVWPGTTTSYGNALWKIVSMEIGDPNGHWGAHGELLSVSEKGLAVASGIGYIIITRFKLASGKSLSPKEYIAGHSIECGVILGG